MKLFAIRTRLEAADRAGLLQMVLPLALLCACAGGDDAGSSGVIVTDSAGVSISEYPPSALADAPVTLTEVTRIGSFDSSPDEVFDFIAGGIILPDTSIVLADRGTGQVRRFARDGSLLNKQGGPGSGPGEYDYIRGTARCVPDGFTVFDIDWTMNHYDAEGDFTGVRPVLLEDRRSPYNLACRGDGTLAVLNWDAAGIQLGFHTAPAQLRLLSPEGAEIVDLGERIGSERHGTPHGSGPHPIGRSTRIGFQGADLIASDGSFFGFERWSASGQLMEIVRIPVSAPDPDSLMAEYLDGALATAQNDDQRRELRLEVERMGAPERASLLEEMLTSEAGVLLRELSLDDSGRWFAFEPDGRPIGWLPLPAKGTLLDWTGDFVLLALEDENGVPVGVLYRLDAQVQQRN